VRIPPYRHSCPVNLAIDFSKAHINSWHKFVCFFNVLFSHLDVRCWDAKLLTSPRKAWNHFSWKFKICGDGSIPELSLYSAHVFLEFRWLVVNLELGAWGFLPVDLNRRINLWDILECSFYIWQMLKCAEVSCSHFQNVFSFETFVGGNEKIGFVILLIRNDQLLLV